MAARLRLAMPPAPASLLNWRWRWCCPPPTARAPPGCFLPAEDTAAYIHRVGRTARYVKSGRGLLLLLPSEREGMLKQVGDRGVGWFG